MSNDPNAEIAAMTKIAEAFNGLDPEAIKRVISWTAAHYGLPVASAVAPKGKLPGEAAAADSVTEFSDIADLYDAANPKTEAERALVVGYWFQKIQGDADFGGYRVNSELRDLGHEASNITVAFTSLQDRKPRLARQVRKTGTSKQARKQYKLTTEGIRKVEQMLHGGDAQEDG